MTPGFYAFHMYERYEATSSPNMKRKFRLRYPGVETRYGGAEIKWNREAVAAHIKLPFEWANKNGLGANRIVMAEYGCMRLWPARSRCDASCSSCTRTYFIQKTAESCCR